MKYRDQLPQLNGTKMLTDGGLETVLIFDQGIDLPEFAAFPLLDRQGGEDLLDRYLEPYVEIARNHGRGLLMECHTWRASLDWGRKLGYDETRLDAVIRRSVASTLASRERWETDESPMVVSGTVGPRGDGYAVASAMSAQESEAYHERQIRTLAESDVDMVSALTLNYADEAIGIIRAAKKRQVPAVISFTVETDGRLPDRELLGMAIRKCDALTDGYASYYMINCAHPTHFRETLIRGESDWIHRISGVRANASQMSHAELDEAETLDNGDPMVLGQQVADLAEVLPNLSVFGGCCGTDHRHIESIARAIG